MLGELQWLVVVVRRSGLVRRNGEGSGEGE